MFCPTIHTCINSHWRTGNTAAQPHRFHASLRSGQLSQADLITKMLLDSTVESGSYNGTHFCRRIDEELFPQLDGTPMTELGGYTSQSSRDLRN